MAKLLDRYMGPRWSEDPDHAKIWDRIHRIPDLELWRTHERRRERLVAFARQRLQEQVCQRGASSISVQTVNEILHPQALTIGFARRFATYKRGDLILRDPARLARLLGDPERPVQLIFAGKAHPKDHPGKEVIKKIVHLLQQPEFRHRIVFIEDYDLNVARYLVQGVDVWLNNPLRPLEACGTSGMKAAANGALNLSVLDGWWDEGYQPGLGWAIGAGEEYENRDYQDEVESQAIYHLLERTILPLFYERGRDGLPREWIAMMKKSMQVLAARFNSHRMVQDYVHQFYLPLARQWRQVEKDRFQGVRALTDWIERIRRGWPEVRILGIQTDSRRNIELGRTLSVEVSLALGKLVPQDLSVDLYFGSVDSKAKFLDRATLPFQVIRQEGEKAVYQGAIPCGTVGRFGFRVRVLPFHPLLGSPLSLGLLLWGGEG
jgi:starch phosphorylase